MQNLDITTEADFRLILNSATDALYCVNTNGETTLCNTAFLRQLGYERESDVLGVKLHDIIHHSHPDGTHYNVIDCPIYKTAKGGKAAHVPYELFFRADGSAFPVEYWVSPIVRDGVLQGAICNFLDITQRLKAQDKQLMLVRELEHRVKNLFAIVGSIVNLSGRGATDIKTFQKNIRGRLSALASAHDMIGSSITNANDQTPVASLEQIIDRIVRPYDDSNRRIKPHGPVVFISAQLVTNLSLVFHELVTNSVKYGALSEADGSLELEWSLNDGLEFLWIERNGPTINNAPTVKGFGGVLIESTVKNQMKGDVTYYWKPEGLEVHMRLSNVGIANHKPQDI